MDSGGPQSGRPGADDAYGALPVDELRELVMHATQHLLGNTIGVTDEQWRGPSRLPGWTRGHVATHVARQAGALVRLISGARTGQPVAMYAPGQRDSEIEEGAARSGLDLQIDLDTSAGALSEAFEAVDSEGAWERPVELRGRFHAPLRFLPLARLGEVVLHHVDLDIGFEVAQIDQATADRLLQWAALRMAARPDFAPVRVRTPSGDTLVGAGPGAPAEVSGSSADLLGWLTGRSGPERVVGAAGIVLPPV
jgi:maleylpyruvate isomerase